MTKFFLYLFFFYKQIKKKLIIQLDINNIQI